eukprot:1508784-Pyramimonas_sp.AAC.1
MAPEGHGAGPPPWRPFRGVVGNVGAISGLQRPEGHLPPRAPPPPPENRQGMGYGGAELKSGLPSTGGKFN